MNVLLVKIHEPLVIDEGQPRLLRMSLIAEKLIEAGHKVTYWSSDLDYRSRENRFGVDKECHISKNYSIWIRTAPLFKKHVSFNRLIHNYVLSKKLERDLVLVKDIDLILCSFPTIELAAICAAFGVNSNVPVVIDIRDLWPDIFEIRLSKLKRLFGWFLIKYWRNVVRKSFLEATCLTAISPGILRWAQNQINVQREFDKYFYHGYPSSNSLNQVNEILVCKKLESMGVHVNFKKFTICYLGQLTQTVDFDDVIAGMAMLKRRNQNVQLIVCGTGDKEVEFRRKADGLENIIFTGWVGSDVGAFIMKSAKASLICYHSTPDYEMSIPNKIPEYLSYGLPILCSIDGYPREIIEKNNCGIYYKSGSVNSFVESVNALCMNPYSRSTMSQNAVKTFSDNFSSEVVYGAMVKHLEGVVRQFRGC